MKTWTEADIVEGLAKWLWREAMSQSGEKRKELRWEDEYAWVQDKWRRYARAAITYLSSVPPPLLETERPDHPFFPQTDVALDSGTGAQNERQTRPTTTDTDQK